MGAMTMKHSLPLAAMAALLALAGCGGETSTTVDTANDAESAELNTANVATPMPLMIKAQKIYRCKDNSVAYVDFMTDDMTANLRTEKDGKANVLKAAAAGEVFEADGVKLAGNGEEVTITLPGKGAQSCHTK